MKKYDALINKLVRIRKELRITQKTIAMFIGTSRSTISRLENGYQQIKFTILFQYAKALGYRLVVDFN